MTEEQAVQLLDFLTAIHTISLKLLYYLMGQFFLMMILSGVLIGYIVGGKGK